MAQGDGDLNIRINTSTDPKGLQEAKKQIDEVKQSAEKAAPAINKAKKEIEETGKKAAPEAQKGLKGVEGGVRGLLDSFTKFKAGALGAIGVVAGAIAGLKRAVVEYGQAQSRVFKLDAALRQQGQLVDSVRTKYQELASTLQETTAVADDEWVGVMTRLAQFGVKPEQMEKMVEFTKNLAGVMGGDVQQAAEAVVRALGGNFIAFTRLGIQIPTNISQFEKLKIAMEQAAEIGGGQLEASASGVEGQFKRLENSTSDLFEALGGLIAASRVLEPPIKLLNGAAKLVSETFGGVIPKAEGMDNLFKRSSLSAQDAAAATERYTKALANFEKEASKINRLLGAEKSAHELVKEQQDAAAKAQLKRRVTWVRSLQKSGVIKDPAQADKLIASFEDAHEEGQFQRDQAFRGAQIANLSKQEQNERQAITNADLESHRAQQAAREEARIMADYKAASRPIRESKARKEAELASLHGRLDVDQRKNILKRQIAEDQANLDALGTYFNETRGPVNPLALQVDQARENARAVKESHGDNLFKLHEQIGQEQLRYDTAAQVRGIDRESQAIERDGLLGGKFDATNKAHADFTGRVLKYLETQAEIYAKQDQRLRQLESRERHNPNR
jgi:hypothetical protein